MSTDGNSNNHHSSRSLLPWVGIPLVMVLGFFLLTEHRAHFFGVLPWLIFLVCPLMHLFMHKGHHGHAANQAPTAPTRKEDAAHGS